MKRKLPIEMGEVDPNALKDPRVARFQSKEFREKLIDGMREAKEMALKTNPPAVPKTPSHAAKA